MTFSDTVGAVTPLGVVIVNNSGASTLTTLTKTFKAASFAQVGTVGAGTVAINGGSVTTSGEQSY